MPAHSPVDSTSSGDENKIFSKQIYDICYFFFPRRGNSHRVRPHWTSMHLAFATFLMSNQHVPRAHPTIGTARAARVAFDKSSPQRDGKGPIKCVFLVNWGRHGACSHIVTLERIAKVHVALVLVELS
jgi:hypothetical protein